MDAIEIDRDDSEVGYPEKLASVVANGWVVSVAHRAGRYSTNSLLLSDVQLIAEAQKTEGGANYYLVRTASPRYGPSWDKFKNDASLVLLGNKAWLKIFFDILSKIEKMKKLATVSVHLYNPMNIVVSLAKLCSKGDSRYIPCFQLITAFEDEVVLYVGVLAWNGRHISMTGREWIKKVYGSVEKYMLMQHFGEQFAKEDIACGKLGLSYIVFEVRRPGSKTEEITVLSLIGGKYTRTVHSAFRQQNVADFCSQNESFCISLVRDLGEVSIGLVN